jgi:hypothetical protein
VSSDLVSLFWPSAAAALSNSRNIGTVASTVRTDEDSWLSIAELMGRGFTVVFDPAMQSSKVTEKATLGAQSAVTSAGRRRARWWL